MASDEVSFLHSDMDEHQYKAMILEQACYFCQHIIIQSFMPEDITTFGLNPVLPAMATLHSIIATQHSMKEMEQAIQLLEFVQSSISEPSKDMQRIYIDLLVEFKMKAVFYEVFSREEEEKSAVLGKYFDSDFMEEICSVPDAKECTNLADYNSALHTGVYHSIKNILFSESLRREYKQTHFLDFNSNRDMWTKLSMQMEEYIVGVRKMLPPPQLVKTFLIGKSLRSAQSAQQHSLKGEEEPRHQSLEEEPPVVKSSVSPRKLRIRQALVCVEKLPISVCGEVYARMKPRQKPNWFNRESSSDEDGEVIGRTRRRRELRKGKGQSSRYAQKTSERGGSSSPVCVITRVSHAQRVSESEESSSSIYERGSSDSSNEESERSSGGGNSPTRTSTAGGQTRDEVIVVSESDYTSGESCSSSDRDAEETGVSRTGETLAREDWNGTGGRRKDWSGDGGKGNDSNRSRGKIGGWDRDSDESNDWNRENSRNGTENRDWDGEDRGEGWYEDDEREWNRDEDDEGREWNRDEEGREWYGEEGEEWDLNRDRFANEEWNRDEDDYYPPLGDGENPVDWENWEEQEVVSPSLLTTPHKPAPNSHQPDPKELRMTSSTARLKGFLPPGVVSHVSPTPPASYSPSPSRAPLANSGHPSGGTTSDTAIGRLAAHAQPLHAGTPDGIVAPSPLSSLDAAVVQVAESQQPGGTSALRPGGSSLQAGGVSRLGESSAPSPHTPMIPLMQSRGQALYQLDAAHSSTHAQQRGERRPRKHETQKLGWPHNYPPLQSPAISRDPSHLGPDLETRKHWLPMGGKRKPGRPRKHFNPPVQPSMNLGGPSCTMQSLQQTGDQRRSFNRPAQPSTNLGGPSYTAQSLHMHYLQAVEKRKPGRPRKYPPVEPLVKAQKQPPGRPRKETRKPGRPRKYPFDPSYQPPANLMGPFYAAQSLHMHSLQTAEKRKPGRPRKNPVSEHMVTHSLHTEEKQVVSRPANPPAQPAVNSGSPSRSLSSSEVKRKRGRPQKHPEQPSSASDSSAANDLRFSEENRKRGKPLQYQQPDTGVKSLSPMGHVPGAALPSTVLSPIGGMSVLLPTSGVEVEVETSSASHMESPGFAANNKPVHDALRTPISAQCTLRSFGGDDSNMQINHGDLSNPVSGAPSSVPRGGRPLIRRNTKVTQSLPRLSGHPTTSFASPEVPVLSAKPSLQMTRRQPPRMPSDPKLPVGSMAEICEQPSPRAILATLKNLNLGRPTLRAMNQVIQIVLDYPESQLDTAAERLELDFRQPYLESEEEQAASEDIVSDSTGDTDKDLPVKEESLQELSKLTHSKANT